MIIENADGTHVEEMPDSLAKLLIEHHDWHKSRRSLQQPEPLNFNPPEPNDEPLPMTHIPGVVPGISMNRLKKLVADGTIPFTLVDRKKLVRPSDVRGYLESGKA